MSRVLILGYSSLVQRRVLPALEALEECSGIAIASLSKPVPLQGKVTRTFKDYELAIRAFGGEFVYISTSNESHALLAGKSLSAGLDVILDKPAVLSVSEADTLVRQARSAARFVVEATVFQYHPAWRRLLEKVVGVRRIEARFTIPELPRTNFRMMAERGGGAVADMASYSIGLGRLVWGESPSRVSVDNVRSSEGGVTTRFDLLASYDDGRVLRGSYGFGLEYCNQVRVFGGSGSGQISRVFSPPADYESEIRGTLDDSEWTERLDPYDTFKGFLGGVMSRKPTVLQDWEVQIQDSGHDLQRLMKECNRWAR